MDEEYRFSKEEIKNLKEITQFTPQEIEKIERVQGALERKFNAEASKESQQKFRILFERAAKEWLPFIIYCLTFGPVSAVSVYNITKLEGWWQLMGWIGLILIMVVPILSAPFLHKQNKKVNENEN